jgi:hypothetical protein
VSHNCDFEREISRFVLHPTAMCRLLSTWVVVEVVVGQQTAGSEVKDNQGRSSRLRSVPFASIQALAGACRLASLQSCGTFATSAHGTNTGVAALTGISGAGKDDSLRVLLSREPTHVRGDRRQLRNGHVGQLLAIQRRVGSSVWMSGRDRGSL